jgi:hypothetical protein
MISAEAALSEIMTQRAYEPMTRDEAQGLANEWYGMGASNGIAPADLDTAAGMPLTDYILRTFGESGQELSL